MRTLIAYATKHGSARACARLLAEQLDGQTIVCDLAREKTPDLCDFDQVIVGGSIYIGKIRPQANQFLTRNQSVLLQKKLGLFICCMAVGPEAEKQVNAAFPAELQAHAAFAGSLGGAFFFSDMNWLEKKMIKMIASQNAAGQPNTAPITGDQDIDQLDRAAISRCAAIFNQG